MRPASSVRFEGMCDASAGVPIGDDRLLVASDEDDVLRLYSLEGGGGPIATVDLTEQLSVPDPGRESDLEASAALGDHTFWIGSHGRSRSGKKRPNRRVLIATQIMATESGCEVKVVGAHHSSRKRGLLGAMVELPTIGPVLAKAARRAPKEAGGLNIEGLAAAGGSLVIGFRNPIVDGRAIVVRLHNPTALLAGEAPELSWTSLDLGGRGVRSILERPDGSLLLIGGAFDSRPHFAAFRWSGRDEDDVEPVALELGNLRPEGLVPLRGDRLAIISDDGGEKVGKRRCKDLPRDEQAFRVAVVEVPGDD